MDSRVALMDSRGGPTIFVAWHSGPYNTLSYKEQKQPRAQGGGTRYLDGMTLYMTLYIGKYVMTTYVDNTRPMRLQN